MRGNFPPQLMSDGAKRTFWPISGSSPTLQLQLPDQKETVQGGVTHWNKEMKNEGYEQLLRMREYAKKVLKRLTSS